MLSLLLFFAAIAAYIQPLEGDLTRLGGYAERDFGWNTPQVAANQAYTTARYDAYSDVVVLGDSFSRAGIWQRYFSAHTGLSYKTLELDHIPVEHLVDTPAFVMTPPKLVVVQSIERYLLPKFGYSDRCESRLMSSKARGRPLFRLLSDAPAIATATRKSSAELAKMNLDYAYRYLEKSLLRGVFGTDFTPVRQFALTRADLFSHRHSDRLLVSAEDLTRNDWSDGDVKKIACGIMRLQDLIEANGKTYFVLLVVPDKLTVYRPYSVDPPPRRVADTLSSLQRYGIAVPHTETAFSAALRLGVKDIFLPNDTHLGIDGYALLAQSLIEFLSPVRMNQ